MYTAIIRTDDPNYIPASSSQLKEVMNMVLELRDEIKTKTEAMHLIDSAVGSPSPQNGVQGFTGARFSCLAAKWREETAFCSSLIEMATHPAYQQIIGMGRAAVPCILRELAREPDHWFWALKAITGEDPVPEKWRGDLKKMTEAWLEWGARSGY
jgi:hypothetical protein